MPSSPSQQTGTTIVNVPCNMGYSFYSLWLSFLRPLHRPQKNDIHVLTHLLLRREELEAATGSRQTADRLLLTTDGRRELCSKAGCSENAFRQSLYHLRKCGAIKDGRIEPRLIPRLNGGDECILMVHFCINEKGSR